ncbi:isochorismate synthase MenF [Puniceibacterium sp. IMCC21224]|uniref:isochorismate synthase n=1 Tax=Puniceibacterium sp. IMCC21224 TaxID=1618204 RepID=UPI00065D6A5E|nr:isochorismate synthase [Puniceibacterium sp. IMCC21224]KMK66991.1 isochorismate synthase [Puniceibacterium sp. IMCC21224]
MAQHEDILRLGEGRVQGAVQDNRALLRVGGISGFGRRGGAIAAHAAELAKAATGLFARSDAPPVVLGALPFDPGAPGFLIAPEEVHIVDAAAEDRPAAVAEPLQGTDLTFRESPSREAYAAHVAEALVAIAAGDLDKVVLARALDVEGGEAFDIATLVGRLASDSSTVPYCLPLPGSNATLVGASPELLVSRTGRNVLSHPLAGSARRRRDAVADRAAAAALNGSLKDRHEHALVAEHVRDILAPFCRQLTPEIAPTLSATPAMWHLGSRIEGELKDAHTPVLDLVAALHPTPAVCGSPTAAAASAISRLEPVPRGYYAGAVGWSDAQGDGAWHVAIRCAVVQGASARLFAGAGVVAGSDPAAEAEETAAKFGTLLAALGLSPRLLLQGRTG